ncbi:JAB domain-containing protein [Cellvibrio sp. UBA7671]|uniref:JAB domain-containing protein n=1 Tax=Cellvibrio sp. UBA7671 TaxID=1946312 RepID=UPI002F35CDAA
MATLNVSALTLYKRLMASKTLNDRSVLLLCKSHNHPSGVAEPSQADCRITQRLQAALDLIDVRVIDHMVVGDSEVISFAERGLL